MTGSDYAALYARVTAQLNTRDYGRNGRHAMGTCPVCRKHVCIRHHSHTQEENES